MSVLRRRLLMGGRGGDEFHLTANPKVGDLDVRLRTIACGVDTIIAWGDGAVTNVPANTDTDVTHTYSAAGSYRITIPRASQLTKIYLQDSKLSGLNTRELRRSTITYWYVTAITNSIINSAHMVNWRPVNWQMFSMAAGSYAIDSVHMVNWRPGLWNLSDMPAGSYAIDSADMVDWRPAYCFLHSMPAGSYAIDSADMVDWRPASWLLHSMPAGSYAIDSADMVDWRPGTWRLYSMPAGSITNVTAASFAGWVGCSNFRAHDNGLNQTQVNAMLWGLYQAATARTATGGEINVGGTNDAPTGTFQAASVCPVSVATPGKEIAHELLNNGCGGINLGRVWATVNMTA